MSTAGIYNYHPKLEHLNEQLPQMVSEGFKPPFYLGGSQVPISLGFEHYPSTRTPYTSSTTNLNNVSMVGHGLGVGLKTTHKKNDNIRLAKYMFHK
jgi:hypothetical protein